MRSLAALVACGLLAAAAPAQPPVTAVKRPEIPPPPKKPEVREVDLAEHAIEFTKGAVVGDPLKLTTAGDLKLSPLEPVAAKLKVDFKAEYVLLFQWQGSGKDKLVPEVAQKDGKAVYTFTLKPGATEDLRPHSRAFVLPAGAEWKVVK